MRCYCLPYMQCPLVANWKVCWSIEPFMESKKTVLEQTFTIFQMQQIEINNRMGTSELNGFKKNQKNVQPLLLFDLFLRFPVVWCRPEVVWIVSFNFLKVEKKILAENTHLLWNGKHHFTADLQFYWVEYSCFYIDLATDLLVWSNLNQSNGRSVT